MTKILRNKKALVALTVAVIALFSWISMSGGDAQMADVPLIPVQKGTLQINVLQGGEIRALSNYEVKSEIELPTKSSASFPKATAFPKKM